MLTKVYNSAFWSGILGTDCVFHGGM